MEQREMYTQIAALIGSIGKAFSLTDDVVAKAVETGEIVIQMAEDDDGEHFLRVSYYGKAAHLYQGAIYYENMDGTRSETAEK